MSAQMNIYLPRRSFHNENEETHFTRNAIIGSILVHLFLILLKMPDAHVKPKEKLSSIKMKFITPPASFKERMKKIPKIEPVMGIEKTIAKSDTSFGDPKSNQMLNQKSKAGSQKRGPASIPKSSNDNGTANEGYSFNGKGLKALTGSSDKMQIAAGSGGGTIGSMKSGNDKNGDSLTGDYKSPTGKGDGSGHILGKDQFGSYDRSITAKGLANKKGFDTAFANADTVVLGSIEPEVLRKILQEYLPQFKFCYQQELQEQSEKVKGIVDLNFRIESDGKVSVVNIKSPNAKFSSKGIACMGNILHMIEFPKPKGGGLVDVRQPLNFSSESTKI